MEARYYIARRKACNKLRPFPIHPKMQTQQLSWFVNANVPEAKVRAMTQEIARLRQDRVVDKIVENAMRDTISSTCRERAAHIVDADVMDPFWVLAIGPPVLVVVLSLACSHILAFSARRRLDSETGREKPS